jgi:hypothetical protein
MLESLTVTEQAVDKPVGEILENRLPPGVVFSDSPDCLWAWARLLRLAREVDCAEETIQ